VFVALGNQQAMRMRHFAICGLSISTIFFPRYVINVRISGKKFIEYKMCVLSFWETFVGNIFNSKKK